MLIQDTLLRDIGRLFIWFPFRWIMEASPYKLAVAAADTMGVIDHHLCSSRREHLVRNLGNAFEEGFDVRSVAKRIMQTHYLNLLELFKFPAVNSRNLHEYITLEGKHYIDEVLEKGKGAILATLHFGTMQFPLVALGHMGYSINQVGDRDPSDSRLSYVHRKVALKYRMQIESTFKAKHIYISKSLRSIYRSLNNNELVMLNVDGVGGIKGKRMKQHYLPVDFLGNEVLFPSGAARLSRRTGAPVVPVICIRDSKYKHKVIVGEPITSAANPDPERDIEDYTKRIIGYFEQYIKSHPEQWLFWMEFERGYLLH
jgi:KDO2-lipid IV(A) lauroyltransferase